MPFYYAQVNEENIAFAVSQLSGDMSDYPNLIRIESYDTSLLGKRWNGSDWEEVVYSQPELAKDGFTAANSQWLSYSGRATDEQSGGISNFSNGDVATAFSVSNSNGTSYVIVQRISVTGEVLWSLDIGADYSPGAGSVLVGNDDTIYVVGGTKKGASGESGKNDSDVYAAAISGSGQKLWYKNYGIGIHEIGSQAILDADGHIILNGRVSEVNDGYSFIKDVPNFYGAEFSGGWRGFQLKINPADGTVVKAYTTGSANSGGELIAVDQSRNITFNGGYTFGAVNGVGTVGNGDPAGANKYLIARNETTGTVLWTRMENWIRSNIVSQEAEDAIYFVDKGLLEKVKGSTGETLWSKSIANLDYVLSPIEGGGILLADSKSTGLLTVRRYDESGNEIGHQTIEHSGDLYPRSFIEKGNGVLLITGSTTGSINTPAEVTSQNQRSTGIDSFVMQVASEFSDPPINLSDWQLLVSEDFEDSSHSWSSSSRGSTSFYGKYLGDFDSRQKDIQIFKTYTVDPSKSSKISLDFIRFDSWSWGESVKFYLNDQVLFEKGIDQTQNLTEAESVVVGNITLTFTPNNDYGERGHSASWKDQSFTIEILIPEGQESLKLGISANLDQTVGDESWGVDNVEIFQSNHSKPGFPIIRGNSLYTVIDKSSWTEAEAYAVKLGGHLASFNDANERIFLAKNIYGNPEHIKRLREGQQVTSDLDGYFVGFSDQTKQGIPEWLDPLTDWNSPADLINEQHLKDRVFELQGYDYGEVHSNSDGTIANILFGYRESSEYYKSAGIHHRGIAEIPFVRRGDSAYVIVAGPTWEEAEANANALGGHLVTINDAEENEWLANLTYRSPDDNPASYWIGLTDSETEGSWQWISGEVSNFSNWHPGEPSSTDYVAGPEDFVVINSGNTEPAWIDVANSNAFYRNWGWDSLGIAEIKLTPNNTPIGTPALLGDFKAGQVITIDRTPIQDSDNFEGWTPTYKYSWEVANDPGLTQVMPIWESLTTADATDGDENLEITDDLTGKLIRGVVSYLDGYGTNETVYSSGTKVEASVPTQRLISLPTDLTAKVGQIIEVPITINQAQDLQSLDLNFAFDPELFSVPTSGGLVRAGSLTSSWTFTGNLNTSTNTLKVSGFSSESLSAVSGDLAYLRLQVKGTAPRGEAVLDLISTSLNEDELPVELQDGSLTITAPKVSITSDLKASIGGSIGIPITIDDASDLQSIDLVFAYDPTIFSLPTSGEIVSGSTLTGDWSFAANTATPGQIKISGYGTTPLEGGEGGLVNLNLKINSGVDTGSVLLDLVSASFNEGAITADLIDGTLELLPPTFQVMDVRQTASGLALRLSEAPDLEKLNLYDGQDKAIDLPDLRLTRSDGTAVDDLSVHWKAETSELYVIHTDSLTGISQNQFGAGASPFQSDLLAAGDYTLVIDARNDGLVSALSGELIDGNSDGITGDAFSYSFTKSTPSNLISIADTARGSGQSLGLNGIAQSNGINGLPVLISTNAAIRSLRGTVTYNATAFNNASLVVGRDLPEDWTLETQEDVIGSLNYTASGTTAITGTDQELFRFDAVVSQDATYGSSTLIEATVEAPDDPTLTFESDPSLVVLAYSGDTTGNGGHSSLDASLIQRVVVDLDSGFDDYDTLAPTLIGDTTGNGGLSSLDASFVQQEVVGLKVDSFPSIPSDPLA